jgi:hypothetical protein
VTLIGNYTSGDFVPLTSSGHFAVTDPAVASGGSVAPGASDIAHGAHATLAYSEKSAVPSLGVSEGRHAAALALLGNYMAGSFATTAAGQGGTLVSAARQTDQQPLAAHPPHG